MWYWRTGLLASSSAGCTYGNIATEAHVGLLLTCTPGAPNGHVQHEACYVHHPASCLAGHDSQDLSGGQVWCLNTQVDHKVQLMKQHVMAPGKPPAVILAHSIGSYMMLKVTVEKGLLGS